MPTTHGAGELVVVVGKGIGRVLSVDSQGLRLRLSEGEVAVNSEDAESLLRSIVDPTTAQRFLERLCERCTEERRLPELRSIRELVRAPLDRQVEYTRWYFRRKKALHPKEAEVILVVSEYVLAEIAASLGLDEISLRAAVKKGTPVVEAQTVRALPAPPELPDAEFLRSFFLGNTAIVGEQPEQAADVLRVAVKPGAWHAYLYDNKAEDDASAIEGLLLVHAEGGDAPVANLTVDLGGVNLEGGTIGVLDAAALAEDAFGVDEVERLRRDGNGYGDRGEESTTWGDGDHRVLVNTRDAATGILVPF
jgi:hypothetical protein